MADSRKRLIAEVRAVVDGAREVERLAGGLDDVENRAQRQYRDPTDNMRKGVSATRTAVIGLTTAFTALGGAIAIRELIQATDQYRQLTGQLNTVTESQEETNQRFRELRGIANETFAPLRSTIELYTRVTRATEELGDATEAQVLRFTQVVNQAIAASGASQEEASNATRQLTQGLASGIFRAEEFNSVLEQTPRLAQAIADGLGVSIGKLREMLLAGELTSDKVFQAILDQTGEIEREFKALPKRVDQSLTQLRNDLTAAFGKADVDGLVESIDDFREIVTDPEFVNAVTELAEAVFDLGAGLAEITKFLGGPGELNTDKQEEQLNRLGQELQRLLGEQERMVDAGEDIVARAIGNRIEEVKRAIRRLGVTPEELLSEMDSGGGSDNRDADSPDTDRPDTGDGSSGTLGMGTGLGFGTGSSPAAATGGMAPLNEEFQQMLREGRELMRENRTAMEVYSDRVERLNALLDAGAIDQETYNAELKDAKEALKEAGEQADETGEEMSEFARQARRNIQDELGDTLRSTLKGNFDEIGRDWEDLIFQMATEAAAAQLGEWLFGEGDGFGGGAIGAAIAALGNSGSGGSTGMGGSSPAAASGGGSDYSWVSTLFSAIGSFFHEGGIVGQDGRKGLVPAGAWAGAPRFHGGGIAGLEPKEIPIIAKEGEEVLRRDDPRHRANFGGGEKPQVNQRILNVLSEQDIADAMSGAPGEEVILNVIQRNPEIVRSSG